MKKIVFLYFLLQLLIIPVWARDYKVLEYIPVDNEANVYTDKFDYKNFVFSSEVNDKGDHLLKFETIHNNNRSTSAVSINLLIFDADKNNIGLLSYCSDKDNASKNSGFKIVGGNSVPFEIIIDSSYFVSGKSMNEAYYVAVLDDNKYCKIEDNNKYAGLSLEDIVSTINDSDDSSFFSSIGDLFSDVYLLTILLITIVVLIVLAGLGFLFNNLYRKMYGKSTILAYIPIVNFFISMEMAFGKIVASIYMVFLIISVIAYFFKIRIILYIFLGIFIISIIIVIIKIITGKYELFYLEPSMDSSDSVFNDNSSDNMDALNLDYNDLTSSNTQTSLQDVLNKNDSTKESIPELNQDEDSEDDFSEFTHF